MAKDSFDGWLPGPNGILLRCSCPHCGVTLKRMLDRGLAAQYGANWNVEGVHREALWIGKRGELGFQVHGYICPACDKPVADLHCFTRAGSKIELGRILPIEPLFNERAVPAEVPHEIADDYREATRIIGLSSKGSATLLRRCLQATLRNVYPDMPRGDLFVELGWVMKETPLDADLKKALGAVRKLGNFGAHPEPDGLTEVYSLNEVDLQTCCLILEALWDAVYVRPAQAASQMLALTTRLFTPKAPPPSSAVST